MFSFTFGCPLLIWIILWISLLPCVAASTTPFPKITFSAFSNFISSTFDDSISLATVLMIFFTLTENVDLLNLHARQKNPQLAKEHATVSSAWMRALCSQLKTHLPPKKFSKLFRENEFNEQSWENDLCRKLDDFAEHLGLTPYQNGIFNKKLLPISQKSIQPEYVICPLEMECANNNCRGQHLTKTNRGRDMPIVTLIKGSSILKNAVVLTGECDNCQTIYSAHLKSYIRDPSSTERNDDGTIPRNDIFYNNARYLQIGSKLWVDRNFSNSVVNSMYSFHASSNTFLEYWNNNYGLQLGWKLGWKHVWQAFLQESTRTVASLLNVVFETPAHISIDDLTEKAFFDLGHNGRIPISENHSCSECTKPYKETVDDKTIHPDAAPVNMVVLDGIVMGTTVNNIYLFPTNELTNCFN